MAFDVLNTIDEHVLKFFDIRLSPQRRRYMYAVSIGAILSIAMLAMWWVYAGYAGKQEQNAQKALASCMELYEQAAGANATATPWPTVETACKRAHEEYASSNLAPYFLSYQAEALIKQNKIDEAIVVINSMVDSLKTTSPLYYLYATKLALLEMDASDTAIHAKGLQRLEALAADTNNEQRDEALYYVGLYNWHHNDMAKAKESWQKLAEIPAKNQEGISPWMQLVSERLNMLA